MIIRNAVFVTVLLATRLSPAIGALPSCLGACSANSTIPCAPDSLPALISCLNDTCSSNNTLSTYAVTLSPKVEYSCQQSYEPGNDTQSAVLKMTGQGQCTTSPYDFQSFVTSAGNNPWAAGVCHILVYPEASCAGQPNDVELMQHSEGCVFAGGRSTRLDCSRSSDFSGMLLPVLSSNDLLIESVASSYVKQMCLRSQTIASGSSSNDNNAASATQPGCSPASASSQSMSDSQLTSSSLLSSLPSLDSPLASSATASALPWPLASDLPPWPTTLSPPNSTSALNASSRPISSSPTESPMPYLGAAVTESKDATIAAMFALIAAFILL